jgi:hypothetical protein
MSGGDARKVTNAPNGVEQFAWRPNGMDIAYVTRALLGNQLRVANKRGLRLRGAPRTIFMLIPHPADSTSLFHPGNRPVERIHVGP